MHEAIENKDTEIVKLLLSKKDIDVNCIAHFKNEMVKSNSNEDSEEVEYIISPLFMDV